MDNKKAMIKYLNISMVVKDVLNELAKARREKEDENVIWEGYKVD